MSQIFELIEVADSAFAAAAGIVALVKADQLTGPQFETHQRELSSAVKKHRGMTGLESAWQWVPQRPTSFGQFQEAGSCAIEVALKFAEAVYRATECAKVQALGRFKVEPGDGQAFEQWAKAAAAELRAVTLDLDNWTLAALRRDSQLLRHEIRLELNSAQQAAANQASDRKTAESTTGQAPANREANREIRKKFTPYVHCLNHHDEEIQQLAAMLNTRGKPRGKAAEIAKFLDGNREGRLKTKLSEAQRIVEQMKKYEQFKRKEAES